MFARYLSLKSFRAYCKIKIFCYFATIQRDFIFKKEIKLKGKILGIGMISGDDGNRYNFEISDIANLNNRNPDSLAGCEVDFEINEKAAKNIFITGGGINVANLQGQFMASDTQGIRFKFLLAMGLYFGGSFISLIPFLGSVLGPIVLIVAFVVYVFAVLGAKRASESATLLKNFILSMVIFAVTFVLAIAFGGSALLGMFAGYGSIGGAGITLAIILLIVGGIATFVYQLLFARELAFITEQKFLLWGLYANVIGVLTTLILIGWLFIIAAFVLWIIGFYQMKNIRKRTEADVMSWF